MIDERRTDRFHDIMSQYVPQQAVDDIVKFITEYSIHLKITRERQSKFGDYRLPSAKKPGHCISVNGCLEPCAFLLVMLHELAHMLTFIDHGRRVKPHGVEWQEHYRRLILQFVTKGCFPSEVESLLKAYSSTLPLSKKLEREIDRKLNIMPSTQSDAPTLDSVGSHAAGIRFRIAGRSGHTFETVEKLRTRWKCRDVATGRLYTVSGSAPVVLENN